MQTLRDYSAADFYPFHMPGHKRKKEGLDFPNPFFIDITEIEGFDNLHHPQGILKDSMEWAASVYGADRTFYLVNGSTCGLLSAICGCVEFGGKLLMSRNCHKSVYHGVFLNHLQAEYIYPQIIGEYGLQGGVLAEDVSRMLISNPDIRAVLVVSPTYDGIVSDIRAIAGAAHEFGVPLIVDEAHGAHFRYGKEWPAPALEMGADIVIQSLHKTLPSFTQTALLHWKEGYADIRAIERYLHIFQSSSPSYVLMAGIENCIDIMERDGESLMASYAVSLRQLRTQLKRMRALTLVDKEIIGKWGVQDMDLSKVVISTRGTGVDGGELDRILRDRYHLEMEMCGADYVTAITTAWDSEDGLRRLEAALLEIDQELYAGMSESGGRKEISSMEYDYPAIAVSIAGAMDSRQETILLSNSEGRISGEYLYLYPPGIPLIAPGEIISRSVLDRVKEYQRMGLPIQGTEDESLEVIRVLQQVTSR